MFRDASLTRITLLAVPVAAGLTLVILAVLDRIPGKNPPPPPGRGVCYYDGQRLCPGVEPGAGRILACLATQTDKRISDACRKAVEDYRKQPR